MSLMDIYFLNFFINPFNLSSFMSSKISIYLAQHDCSLAPQVCPQFLEQLQLAHLQFLHPSKKLNYLFPELFNFYLCNSPCQLGNTHFVYSNL